MPWYARLELNRMIAFINSLGNNIWNYCVVSGNKQIGCGIAENFEYEEQARKLKIAGMTYKNVSNLVFNF